MDSGILRLLVLNLLSVEFHIKKEEVLDKFRAWFGDSINLCYYSIKPYLELHILLFLTTLKQMIFSFGFRPSERYLQTRHC